MNPHEARRILGLGSDEDPRPHLEPLRNTRERLAEITRLAPNEQLALRYQEQLVDFDKALAAIRESTDTPANSRPEGGSPEIPVRGDKRPRRSTGFCWQTGLMIAWLLTAMAGVGLGYRFHLDYKKQLARELEERIGLLERTGDMNIESRRWQEAMLAFAKIDFIQPGSPVARNGFERIEAGKAEEQTQFIGYWTGQAIAELEANRLNEAQAAAEQVTSKFPGNEQALAIIARVAEARAGLARQAAIDAIRKSLDNQAWQQAADAARAWLAEHPDDKQVEAMLAEATEALKKQAENQAKARELLAQAAARDQGGYDPEAIEWLREATALDPSNKEISALQEKMSSYKRTLRVPGDFATPQEAIANAREKDRILLAEGTWKGPLVIDAAVELQGNNPETTLIECPAANGCAITIGPGSKGARVSGITFRHEDLVVDGSERFAAALVRGGEVAFVDCRFKDASGHGLAVIDQGKANANRCRFSDNAWNGAAVIGAGSSMEIRDSLALNNFEHGIESWNGASVVLVGNRCEGNSRNGIHADNGKAAATIENNQLSANREYGVVLSSAGSGRVTGNTARANLLGGFVIRQQASALAMTDNQATSNLGPGLVLESGLATGNYEKNQLSVNKSPQMLADMKFPETGDSTGGTDTRSPTPKTGD